MRAKEKEMQNYTDRLQKTKDRCDQDAVNSIRLTQEYQNRINQMEIKERELLDNLQTTRTKTNILIKDLSIHSMGLANTL